MATEAEDRDREERAYERGSRAVWLRLLTIALQGLGRDSPEWTKKRWLLEREAAIATLRILCAEKGDNDWPDDLHLSDIIDKHLARHLDWSLPAAPPKDQS